MRSEKKAQRKWLYLADDDVDRLDKLVSAFPALNEAMVLGTLASAALKACERLEPEKEINLERGRIEITAAKSKTRRRRLVTIHDNLAAWLALEADIPGDLEKRITLVWQKAKVTWPHNVTRHSFCSYHLAQFQNAAKTALQAGHSEQMLFSHYHDLVTPEAAAEFWGIVPE